MSFGWNETTEAALRKHHAANLSCSMIAVELHEEFGGRPSRNAVIGKLHRLGLRSAGFRNDAGKPRVKKTRRVNYRLRQRASDLPFTRHVEETPVDLSNDVADNPVRLFDLKHGHCRWPFGDPQHDDFHFCGGRALKDKSYCERHDEASRV
jgi:hypothetical protein